MNPHDKELKAAYQALLLAARKTATEVAMAKLDKTQANKALWRKHSIVQDRWSRPTRPPGEDLTWT